MKENEKLRIQEIIERYDRMYTATIYGSAECANHQKECDFEELVTLVKNIGVIPCCKQLKGKEELTFNDWLKVNNYKLNGNNFLKDNKLYSKKRLLNRYVHDYVYTL